MTALLVNNKKRILLLNEQVYSNGSIQLQIWCLYNHNIFYYLSGNLINLSHEMATGYSVNNWLQT